MNLWKKADPDKSRGQGSGDSKESKSTTIDGHKVGDILHWGRTLLEDSLKAREEHYHLVEGTSFSDGMKNRLLQWLGENWSLREDVYSDDDHYVWNFLFSIIEIQLAMMLSNRAKVGFKPQGAEDVPLADLIGQIVEKEQTNAEPSYDEFQADRALAMKIFGTAFAFVGYTFLRNSPVGRHDFRVCDTLSTFWQYCKDSIYSSKYFIEVRVRDVPDVEEEFDVKLPTDYGQDLGSLDAQKYILWNYVRGSKFTKTSAIKQCLTVDIWYRDSSKEKEEAPVWMIDSATNEEILDDLGDRVQAQDVEGGLLFDTKSTLKYPRLRRIVFTGGHLLYDGHNPYRHGLLPYTSTKNYRAPGLMTGMSEFQQLEDIQYTLDEVVTQVKINAKLTGNNQKVVDEHALEEKQEVTNEPGAIYKSKSGHSHDAIHVVEQSPVSPQAITLYKMALDAKDVISGVTSYVRGEAFAGDSGKKVLSLDAFAARRVAGPLWNIEHSQRREALMVAKNCRQFLPDETVWRISGLDKEKLDALQGAGGIFQRRANGDVIVAMKDIPLDLEWDIRIVPMGDIPSSRDAKLSMLVQLKQVMPEIPGWVLLKYVDIPELSEEAKRLETEWDEMRSQLDQVSKAMQEQGMDSSALENNPVIRRMNRSRQQIGSTREPSEPDFTTLPAGNK